MTLAHLLKPREEVRKSLRERIDEARNIAPTPIATVNELKMAVAREKQWREYNSELLSRIFSTSEHATDYRFSQTALDRVEDRMTSIWGSLSRDYARPFRIRLHA